MTTLYAVATEQPVRAVPLSADQTGATWQFRHAARIPFAIPASQEFFWRYPWQQAERETLTALEAGDGVVFDSDDPEDIVRWLHAPDEPDAG